MTIQYDSETDLLYIRLDQKEHQVINKRVTDDIVLDMGVNDQIIGIEILEASKKVQLNELLPIQFQFEKTAP